MATFFLILVLVLALIVAIAIQVAAALGLMFALHKYAGSKLAETQYGTFDFDNFQKGAFNEFVLRLVAVFAVPTLVLHVFVYLLFEFSQKRHPAVWGLVLTVLEAAAIAGGLFLVYKLDKVRLIAITAGSALVYIVLYWAMISDKLH